MGHASPFELYYSARPADMVKAGRTPPPMNCNEGPRSRFPTNIAFDAMLQNLDRWVAHRRRAAARGADPAGRQHDRCSTSTATWSGGVRSPYVDVPTSTWFGTATGASFCFIAGYERPFSAEKLAQLYPTRADYVAKVEASTRALVAQGFITEEDGRFIMQEARYACTLGPANDPNVPRCWNDTEGTVGGTVPPTLSLTLGAAASFGAFTPGVARDYTASTTATSSSSAGNAALIVQDPSSFYTDHLVNGSSALAQPLQARTSTGAFGSMPAGVKFGRTDRGRDRADRVPAVDRRQRGAAHRQLRQAADVHAVHHRAVRHSVAPARRRHRHLSRSRKLPVLPPSGSKFAV